VNASNVAFICALIYARDELIPILQEHLDDQEGEILPHLLIADIERWCEAQVEARRSGSGPLRAVLDFIEEALSSGAAPEVEELISVSFLEHLPKPGDSGDRLREILGPKTTTTLRALS
jgi:hypothetical protein